MNTILKNKIVKVPFHDSKNTYAYGVFKEFNVNTKELHTQLTIAMRDHRKYPKFIQPMTLFSNDEIYNFLKPVSLEELHKHNIHDFDNLFTSEIKYKIGDAVKLNVSKTGGKKIKTKIIKFISNDIIGICSPDEYNKKSYHIDEYNIKDIIIE